MLLFIPLRGYRPVSWTGGYRCLLPQVEYNDKYRIVLIIVIMMIIIIKIT